MYKEPIYHSPGHGFGGIVEVLSFPVFVHKSSFAFILLSSEISTMLSSFADILDFRAGKNQFLPFAY